MKKSKTGIRRKQNRKNLKTITLLLAAITLIVWLLMLIFKYLITGLEFSTILDDVMSSILGILPPIIIFNFIYEYMTKDFMANEISEQITQTLMSDPETIEVFNDDIKRSFVKSTISSLVGEDKIDMVYGIIEPYLKFQYDIKPLYKYYIDLQDYVTNRDYKESYIFSSDKYFSIFEKFTCRKIFSGTNVLQNTFQVGFFTKLDTLDHELKVHNYIFRESLKINHSELLLLQSLNDEEKKSFVVNCMQLRIHINNQIAIIEAVKINEDGIFITLASNHDILVKDIFIDIGFKIPQVKKRSEFLVSISEPALSPEIRFSYRSEAVKVSAYPFLNEDDDLIRNATHMPGLYEINPQGWIYPVKGVVFIIEEK